MIAATSRKLTFFAGAALHESTLPIPTAVQDTVIYACALRTRKLYRPRHNLLLDVHMFMNDLYPSFLKFEDDNHLWSADQSSRFYLVIINNGQI